MFGLSIMYIRAVHHQEFPLWVTVKICGVTGNTQRTLNHKVEFALLISSALCRCDFLLGSFLTPCRLLVFDNAENGSLKEHLSGNFWSNKCHVLLSNRILTFGFWQILLKLP